MPTLKESIQSFIGHFFEFDQDSLQEQINLIKRALEEKPEVAEDHPYASLQQCYFDPERYFNRLEEFNPGITVDEVQKCIIELITEKIGSTDVAWEKNVFLERIAQSPRFMTEFHSQLVPIDEDEHPWHIPHNKEKIYKIDLLPSYNDYVICPEVKIHLPEDKMTTLDLGEYNLLDLANDAKNEEKDEDELRELLIEHIIEDAEQKASDIIVQRLQNKIPPEVSFWTQRLLLYHFYFNGVLNNTIPLNDISELNDQEFFALSQLSVISLIAAEICDIAKAKKLTRESLVIVRDPFYLQEIIQKKLPLENIEKLSMKQAQFLTSPAIIYLQKKKLSITFLQIRKIRKSAYLAFYNEFFLDLLINEEEKFPFKKVRKLNSDQAKFLAKSFSCHCISAEKISLDEILKMNPHQMRDLKENSVLQQLIIQDILDIKEYLAITHHDNHFPTTIHGLIFSSRLVAILKDNPYRKEGMLDNIDIIKKEIKELYHDSSMEEIITHHTFKFIAHHIKQNPFFNEFCPSKETPAFPWINILNRVITNMQKKLHYFESEGDENYFNKRGRMQFSLFYSPFNQKKYDKLKFICDTLHQITSITNNIETPRITYAKRI